MGQFTFGPPPIPPFFLARSVTDRLGGRIDSRRSSTSSRSRQLRSTSMEGDEAESSTPQSSVVSSVVMVDSRKKVEDPGEASRTRYLERVKDLDLEDLASRQELTEDLSNNYCVDWRKAHEAHFSRAKTLEMVDLTGIPQRSIMGPIDYRPLKELGIPGLIVEPPKHRTSIAKIRVAIPAQLRAADKLFETKRMGLPDTAYMRAKLAEDPRYGRSCGTSQLSKTLAVYDRSDPGAVRWRGRTLRGRHRSCFGQKPWCTYYQGRS